MRLMNVHTKTFEEIGQEKPHYAILSHTWGDEEILYQDILNKRSTTESGWMKILKFCEIAAADGCTFVWIDTCCIDKTNSTELFMSINSMYEGYARSTIFYVYLEDCEAKFDSTNNTLSMEGRGR
jgi:hypothetical protein